MVCCKKDYIHLTSKYPLSDLNKGYDTLRSLLEKTCLPGFLPSKTQTSLFGYIDSLK